MKLKKSKIKEALTVLFPNDPVERFFVGFLSLVLALGLGFLLKVTIWDMNPKNVADQVLQVVFE